MTFPSQPRNIEADRTALAPYNFVPLPERVVQVGEPPDQDRFHPDRHSGYLDCELITASPVYTRAALTLDQAQARTQSKNLPQFFYLRDENQPVIPGSTLRGMLRALVEITSFGKVTDVSPKHLVYRAVGDTTSHGTAYRDRFMRDDGGKHYVPQIRGGYILKDVSDWKIQPAKEIGGTTYAHLRIDEQLFKSLRPVEGCRNAFEVYIKTGAYDFQPVRGGFLHVKFARVLLAQKDPGPGVRRATLAKSGWMFSKRTEAVIYEKDATKRPLRLKDELVQDYSKQLSDEQEALLGKEGVLQEGQPVFYLLDEYGEVFYFGHARMFRVPYPRSVLDFVPASLRRLEEMDFAEAIFGHTKGETPNGKKLKGKAQAYAGRVFVSDATLVVGQQDIWLSPRRPVTLKILSGPKPTTFQHYLVQTRPNKRLIGHTKDDRPKHEVNLSDYAAPTPAETTIRGHKLYWHKGAVKLEDVQEAGQVAPNDTQHTRVQPLRAGVSFRFRVDFQNLSSEELGALLWVLQVGGDDRYRLKLGMGKPLGMGAVSIQPKLSLIDRRARYQQLFEGEGWAEAKQQDRSVEQEALADFERFVIQSLRAPGARRLEDLERIKALLALLSWPGPDPEITRYMEIERPDSRAKRGKRNEYDGRPVLPSPLDLPQKRETPSSQPVPTKPEKGMTSPPPAGYQRGMVLDFGLGPAKSYGYIRPDRGGKDIFVHRSELAGGLQTLAKGDRVIYRVGQSLKGVQAQDVRREE